MQPTVHPATPALVIDDVTKIYSQWQRSSNIQDIWKNLFHPEKRDVTALDHLSLTIEPGEFAAYAGANGAGKSTTIKILSGILQPTSGSVSVLGMNPAKDRIPLMRRAGVLFGQRTELWWDQPVITSFEWKKTVWNIPDDVYKRNLEMVTELLDLQDLLKTFSRELSLGQRMRADIAMLLLHSPEIIFLDEPTLGLDVLAKQQMIRFLKQLNAENHTTIIVTSHDMDDLEEMAKRITLLNKGTIAFDGSFEKLRQASGGGCRVCITSRAKLPEIPGLTALEASGSSSAASNKITYPADSNICQPQTPAHIQQEFEFNPDKLEIHQLLGLLANYPDILDVEIKKAPIEDVIAKLYTTAFQGFQKM